MSPYFLAFLVAAVLGLALTPMAIRLAWATGFLDRPNTALKTQRQPVAYMGGLAVALAFLAALFGVKAWLLPTTDQGVWPASLQVVRGVYAIALGGFIALGLGLLGRQTRLEPAGQAHRPASGRGRGPGVLRLAGALHQSAQWASILVTVLWVVTVTNALNFVDIMDGLAASVGLVAAMAFMAFALNSGRPNDALAAATPWCGPAGLPALQSFQPARIYPWATPARTSWAFVLSAISLNLGYSHQNELAVFSPLAILALPLFDLMLMIVIRTRKGIPPWKGSPDHVPLRLRALGWGVPRVVLTLAAATAAISLVIYAASFLPLRTAIRN